MTPGDEGRVAEALSSLQVDLADRLARIETKLDGVKEMDARLRTVEFAHVTREEVEDMISNGRKLSWRDLGLILGAIAAAVAIAVGVVSTLNVG